jgi:pyruvate/2-oxoglutarate/acetoin dehydrogenase E1 component
LAVAVVGDGTMGESDFHEGAMAASLWKLPMLVIITDNEVAISVTPPYGRGIKRYREYAGAFDLQFFECDGGDFLDTYETTEAAARAVLREGRAALMHVRVPRLMGHSSSSGGQFDFDARDPLLEMGAWLGAEGILPSSALFERESTDIRKSYFEKHRLGLMKEKLDEVRQVVAEVTKEPAPSVEAGDVWRYAHPPFPDVTEPLSSQAPDPKSRTRIQLNEALNAALDRVLATGRGAIWGQDVGERGGVFKVTDGLVHRYPEQVRDAPINEPMIIGTAVGAALHDDLIVLPEIQFGDYTLNCLHWFVYMGNLYWTSYGQVAVNLTVRTPVDPVQGGAIYHSMSVDGFYGNIPGLVITMPSTSYDAYGLLRTAADYRGPVMQLEPKRLYRMRLGPRLPGEPTDPKMLQEARRAGERIPVGDYRIPFGKAARRRIGRDVSVIAWGWAAWQAVAAADRVAKSHGVEAEVWDLRTLKPYDREAIFESARKTGRVLIAQNDRTFAGYGRQIQGDLVETLRGVQVRLVGQLNTPAVGQSRVLEDAITLQEENIAAAIIEMAEATPDAWLENELHWMRYAPSRALT